MSIFAYWTDRQIWGNFMGWCDSGLAVGGGLDMASWVFFTRKLGGETHFRSPKIRRARGSKVGTLTCGLKLNFDETNLRMLSLIHIFVVLHQPAH